MKIFPREIINHDWKLLVLITITLLLASVITSYRSLLYKTLMAPFFKQYYISLQREENEIYKKVSVLLNFISFLSISLFFYFLLEKTEKEFLPFVGFTFFISLFACLLVLAFFQVLIIRTVGWLFKLQNESKEYQFNILLIYKVWGVLLLPLLYFIAYSPAPIVSLFLELAIALTSTVMLRRYFMGLQLSLQINAFPKLYSIVYICSLEFLPLAIVVKEYNTELLNLIGI